VVREVQGELMNKTSGQILQEIIEEGLQEASRVAEAAVAKAIEEDFKGLEDWKPIGISGMFPDEIIKIEKHKES
jgi:hypothetical protein